jgi:hypothetical protein
VTSQKKNEHTLSADVFVPCVAAVVWRGADGSKERATEHRGVATGPVTDPADAQRAAGHMVGGASRARTCRPRRSRPRLLHLHLPQALCCTGSVLAITVSTGANWRRQRRRHTSTDTAIACKGLAQPISTHSRVSRTGAVASLRVPSIAVERQPASSRVVAWVVCGACACRCLSRSRCGHLC